MFKTLALIFLAIAVAATTWWALDSRSALRETRGELTLLLTKVGALETQLQEADNEIALTKEELASVQAEVTSAREELSSTKLNLGAVQADLVLYKDTFGEINPAGDSAVDSYDGGGGGQEWTQPGGDSSQDVQRSACSRCR